MRHGRWSNSVISGVTYLSDWDSAIRTYERAAREAGAAGAGSVECKALLGSARAHLYGKKGAGGALELVRRALPLAQQVKDASYRFDAWDMMAQVQIAEGNYVGAADSINHAFAVVGTIKDDRDLYYGYLDRADIMLTRRNWDLSSSVIRWATNSPFSHAALVFNRPGQEPGITNTFVIEAGTSGVDLTNLRDYANDKSSFVAIKRFKGTWFDEAKQAKACEFWAAAPIMRVEGLNALITAPIPLIRPPPPIAMNRLSIDGACSSSSSPMVP